MSLATAAILFLVSAAAVADVGYSAASSWSSGPVYPDTNATNVAMAEELIKVMPAGNTFHYTVYFRFQNDSAKDETVQVGFPVVTTINSYHPAFSVEHSQSLEMAGVLLGRLDESYESDEGLGDLLKAIDGKERRLTWDQFTQQLEYFGSPDISPGFSLLGFKATAGELPVQLENVLLHGAVVQDKNQGKSAEITTNILFHLRFPAHSIVSVTVDYNAYRVSGSGRGGTSYRGSYFLGTGRTWKGSIGKLYVVGPIELESPFKGGQVFADPLTGMNAYAAKNYEPAADETLSFTPTERREYKEDFDSAGTVVPAASAYSAVDVIGASSTYPGKVTVFETDAKGLLARRISTYGPSALFDGIRTNGWVENIAGPGLQQYVEFQLNQPAFGAVVYNGLAMLPDLDGEYVDSTPALRAMYDKRIWPSNNRVQGLALMRDGVAEATLDLADSWGPQVFIQNISPGRYRATILDVYNGEKWDDTPLGELVFLTVPEAAAALIKSRSPELWKMLWD